MNQRRQPTTAVIGAGVAGLTAAHVMSRTDAVTLFEADQRVGGHAHTHTVPAPDQGAGADPLRVDSGFIVHNERTYPHLLRLFRELDVETRPTEMSMSITCEQCGLSYAGGLGLRGILAQPGRAADPRFIRLLTEVPRFHRAARRLLEDPSTDPTWGQFLRDGGFSTYFVRHFAIPLVACVWSCGDLDAETYPARHLFQFLDHHGMLTVTGSPQWRTVVGGSATYVDRLVSRLPDVRRSAPVTAVERHDDGVDVRVGDAAPERFDRVVIATHANQALDLLADATPQEKEDLAAIRYSRNTVWLHRDSAVLPSAQQARASWNYRMRSCDAPSSHVAVSYWMNRLQGLPGPDEHVVTLDPEGLVDPASVTAEMSYEHPIFTGEAVAAASRLRTAGGERLAFAGAHLGWGFHEDGCRSGVEAAASFGVTW
ncbi:FAD-dependent oxidoreductase [Intrasporangium calvum]|uniref:FAD-dependent oxidoreductase n=1 Tax=Intrasporangium calvum TaxID=53358 RepID=A0ABT5GD42_9MICO|nr:FAD-dependent oxidoreductase [Intrasporangium calvum]MDC5696194.1 FAD-dependent oxidoreductase [Intrasporangium calvum]